MSDSEISAHPIPAAANLAIGAAAIAASLLCLWAASHGSVPAVALAALVFSFSANTLFSLLHEAVHGGFHPDRRVNEPAGWLFAAFFPTSFSVQRVSHLGHHRRNRSDAELYDYYLPGQSRWLKTYWIYCLLTGFYWMVIPLAGLIYLLCPWGFRSRRFREGPARWWGFEPFVADIAQRPVREIWPQYAFALLVQAALFMMLDLDVVGWLACYWAFGVNWSSVQYTDHAWSRRDVIEGAWNLRRTRLTQAVFLNYNLHLAHHREPQIPWIHLPQRVRGEDDAPSFWSVYRRLWLGPQPAPPEGGAATLAGPSQPLLDHGGKT
jgi:fatty acid desaturase